MDKFKIGAISFFENRKAPAINPTAGSTIAAVGGNPFATGGTGGSFSNYNAYMPSLDGGSFGFNGPELKGTAVGEKFCLMT